LRSFLTARFGFWWAWELGRGITRQSLRLRPIPNGEKPELLKIYLERFVDAVQRYFPVKAGSPPQAFRDVAPTYPVFELQRADKP
jgi:hypothetical protein